MGNGKRTTRKTMEGERREGNGRKRGRGRGTIRRRGRGRPREGQQNRKEKWKGMASGLRKIVASVGAVKGGGVGVGDTGLPKHHGRLLVRRPTAAQRNRTAELRLLCAL